MRIGAYDVPDVLGEIKELNLFYRVVLHAVERLRLALAEAERETHFDTAESWGLDRWEKILRLTTDDSYTTEERQQRLRIWLQEFKHYGGMDIARWLMALGLVNLDGVTPTIEIANDPDGTLRVTVRAPLASEKNLADIERRLREIVPIGAELDVSAIYKTFADYGAYTWAQLAAFTFEQAKHGVTPQTPPAARRTRNDLAGSTYAALGNRTWTQVRTDSL